MEKLYLIFGRNIKVIKKSESCRKTLKACNVCTFDLSFPFVWLMCGKWHAEIESLTDQLQSKLSHLKGK